MAKRAQMRWDDLTVVLAVIDHGSVSAAARALGVNHATVLRRIAEFETRTGVRMFDKTTRGYQVSPDRRDVIEAMREAADALGNVDRLINRARPCVSDGLRITTTDSLAQYILPGLLSELAEVNAAPVELMVDNAHLDFARMQAHLTVRPASRLPPELDGLPAGQISFCVFEPSSAGDLPWLGLTGPLARSIAADWMRKQDGDVAAYGDSFPALAAMAAAGLGRAVLPNYVGDAHPELSRAAQAPDLPHVPVWVGAHVDFGRAPRIRKARKHLAAALAAHPALQ